MFLYILQSHILFSIWGKGPQIPLKRIEPPHKLFVKTEPNRREKNNLKKFNLPAKKKMFAKLPPKTI